MIFWPLKNLLFALSLTGLLGCVMLQCKNKKSVAPPSAQEQPSSAQLKSDSSHKPAQKGKLSRDTTYKPKEGNDVHFKGERSIHHGSPDN